jgi:hypothetical protein
MLALGCDMASGSSGHAYVLEHRGTPNAFAPIVVDLSGYTAQQPTEAQTRGPSARSQHPVRLPGCLVLSSLRALRSQRQYAAKEVWPQGLAVER